MKGNGTGNFISPVQLLRLGQDHILFSPGNETRTGVSQSPDVLAKQDMGMQNSN